MSPPPAGQCFALGRRRKPGERANCVAAPVVCARAGPAAAPSATDFLPPSGRRAAGQWRAGSPRSGAQFNLATRLGAGEPVAAGRPGRRADSAKSQERRRRARGSGAHSAAAGRRSHRLARAPVRRTFAPAADEDWRRLASRSHSHSHPHSHPHSHTAHTRTHTHTRAPDRKANRRHVSQRWTGGARHKAKHSAAIIQSLGQTHASALAYNQQHTGHSRLLIGAHCTTRRVAFPLSTAIELRPDRSQFRIDTTREHCRPTAHSRIYIPAHTQSDDNWPPIDDISPRHRDADEQTDYLP